MPTITNLVAYIKKQNDEGEKNYNRKERKLKKNLESLSKIEDSKSCEE